MNFLKWWIKEYFHEFALCVIILTFIFSLVLMWWVGPVSLIVWLIMAFLGWTCSIVYNYFNEKYTEYMKSIDRVANKLRG
jgi:Ca2+-dependent lipid-binding protein